jgi:hypothetical protein
MVVLGRAPLCDQENQCGQSLTKRRFKKLDDILIYSFALRP